jgi:hypothetical protein
MTWLRSVNSLGGVYCFSPPVAEHQLQASTYLHSPAKKEIFRQPDEVHLHVYEVAGERWSQALLLELTSST